MVEHNGRLVAALIHHRSLEEDPLLVEAGGRGAALALENEQRPGGARQGTDPHPGAARRVPRPDLPDEPRRRVPRVQRPGGATRRAAGAADRSDPPGGAADRGRRATLAGIRRAIDTGEIVTGEYRLELGRRPARLRGEDRQGRRRGGDHRTRVHGAQPRPRPSSSGCTPSSASVTATSSTSATSSARSSTRLRVSFAWRRRGATSSASTRRSNGSRAVGRTTSRAARPSGTSSSRPRTARSSGADGGGRRRGRPWRVREQLDHGARRTAARHLVDDASARRPRRPAAAHLRDGHHRAQAAGGRASPVARPHRRGERRRAPPARAQPPRRRPAAARLARADAAAWREQMLKDRPRRPGRAGSRRPATELAAGARGAARARARHPPRGAHRPRPDRRARGARARAPLPVDLELLDERLPEPVEAAAYFVVSEALTNVAKYAEASSVAVSIASVNGHVVVEIADDGVGGADPARGSGAARPRRPRRGARRHASRRQPAGRRDASARRSRAGRDRRGLRPAARGRRAPARGPGLRGRRAGRHDAEDLLLKVRSYSPDVAIVDIRMPPTHTDEGLVAAQEIREQYPEIGVLVLSQYVEPTYAMELLAESAEGVGYLLKDRVADVDEFAAAVRRVAEGGSALDPAIVSQLVGRRRRDDPLRPADPARARGARADGRGPLQPGDRRAPRRHRAGRREARDEHLRQARPAARGRGPSPRARGADVPAAARRPDPHGPRPLRLPCRSQPAGLRRPVTRTGPPPDRRAPR